MKIIDLSLPVNNKMSIFPHPAYKQPRLEFAITPDEDGVGRYSGEITIGVHQGTHLDTPMHLNIEPFVKTIANVPLDVLVGEAIVVKLPGIMSGGITAEMIKAKMPTTDTKGKRLLVMTGFNDKAWGTESFFQDAPYLTADAAEWMVEAGFVLVGIDVMTDAILPYPPVHNTLLRNDIYILEYLCNADGLTADSVMLITAPIKIEGFESAPTRVFAIENWKD